ncbi:30490_t:CDS:1, partial [Gigaspora margarita]
AYASRYFNISLDMSWGPTAFLPSDSLIVAISLSSMMGYLYYSTIEHLSLCEVHMSQPSLANVPHLSG